MKKLILSVATVAGFSVASLAQGVLNFDGTLANTSTSPSATTGGQVFINGVLDTATDINAELLYSSTQTGTFSPVVTLLLSATGATPSSSALGPNNVGAASGDATSFPGQIFDNSGTAYIIPGVAAGATAYFEVEGWLGNSSSLALAQAGGQLGGITAAFPVVLSSATGTEAALINMPALNLVTAVPEPSTLAMAGVGLASMLIFRRRNK